MESFFDHTTRAPSVACIGGGTGLSTMLRGLKHYTPNITAIVAVTVDGGGSGILRGRIGDAAAGRHQKLHPGALKHRTNNGKAHVVPIYERQPGRAELWKPPAGRHERHLSVLRPGGGA